MTVDMTADRSATPVMAASTVSCQSRSKYGDPQCQATDLRGAITANAVR
jgi:hypothetical protein